MNKTKSEKRKNKWFGFNRNTPPENESVVNRPNGRRDDTGIVTNIYIPASELQAIGQNAFEWGETETGNWLWGFQRVDGSIVIMLATPPGPNAKHSTVQFVEDHEYFIECANYLYERFGIEPRIRAHSHHRLGISGPSGGDRETAASFSEKNSMPNFVDLILTFTDEECRKIRISAFVYEDPTNPASKEKTCQIGIIPGVSPIRESLMGTFIFPNRKKYAYRFPMDQIEFDSVGSNDMSGETTGIRLPKELTDQLDQLPDSVIDKIRISIKSELIVLTIPLPTNHTGQICYVASELSVPRAVYLQSSESGPRDVTVRVNPTAQMVTLTNTLRSLLRLCMKNPSATARHYSRVKEVGTTTVSKPERTGRDKNKYRTPVRPHSKPKTSDTTIVSDIVNKSKKMFGKRSKDTSQVRDEKSQIKQNFSSEESTSSNLGQETCGRKRKGRN